MHNRIFARPLQRNLLAIMITALVVCGFIVHSGAETRVGADPANAVTEILSGATALTAGSGHTCALMPGGTAKCWGYNVSGQLGDGTTTGRSTPVDVVGLSGAISLTAGMDHTCALMPGGAAKCWGNNDDGQLGNGVTSSAPQTNPVDVVGLSGITTLTAGSGRTCALISGGTAKCWGNNSFGQLGGVSPSSMPQTTPVDVVGVSGAIALATSGQHRTCALMSGGTAKCWGINMVVFHGGEISDTLIPFEVPGLSGATALTVTEDYTCALMPGGTIKCSEFNPRTWQGEVQPLFADPVDVPEISGATAALMTDYSGVCVLMPASVVKCGGVEAAPLYPRPFVDVDGLNGVTTLAGGHGHQCALMPGGSAKCWGDNYSGQLGDGTTTDRTAPVDVLLAGISDGGEPGDGGTPAACNTVYFLAVRGSGQGPQDESIEDLEAAVAGHSLDPIYVKTSGGNADQTGFGGDPLESVFASFIYQLDHTLNGNTLGTVQVRAIRYPAIPILEVANVSRYRRSIDIGATSLREELTRIKSVCGKARVTIAGYSQGADVVNTLMAQLQREGNPALMDQVKQVVYLGDPSHRPNRPENVINWWYPPGLGDGSAVVAGVSDGATTDFLDSHNGLVASICAPGDVVCDSNPGTTATAGLHLIYPRFPMKCPVVQDQEQRATECAAAYLARGLGLDPVAKPRSVLDGAEDAVAVGQQLVGVVKDVAGSALGAVKSLVSWVHSDPIYVGTFPVDDKGQALINFTIPDVPDGEHHLVLTGDDGRTYTVPLTVTHDPSKASPAFVLIDGSKPDVIPPTGGGGSSDSVGSLGSLFGS